MAHDDDPLAGIDLDAWQPPAPPAGLADAVIGRLREPSSVTAIDPDPGAPHRRVAWIAGALALSAAAVTGLAWWGVTRAPRTSDGAILAYQPEHLVLDDTVADLDPGAELRWQRDGHRLTVHQLRGTARWTVAGDDHLRLDAAPPLHPGGAESTAIEASGASLRVEVPMNLADVRIMGTMTGTAAITAVIAVAVYQGHITATSGGQTVRVEPGATLELRPGQPPAPPVPPVHTIVRAPREVSPGELDGLRLTGEPNIAPDERTREAIDIIGGRLQGDFRLCVDPTGHVDSVDILRSTRFDKYDRTIASTMMTWTYRPYLVDGVASPACTHVTFLYTSDRGTVYQPCGPRQLDDDVIAAANQHANGRPGDALATIRNALVCKAEPRLIRLAAIYACAAHDRDTATAMLGKLAAKDRAPIAAKCAADGAPR